MSLPVGESPLLLKVRDTWPRTAKVYCHPLDAWPADAEVVEEVAVRSCVRRGVAGCDCCGGPLGRRVPPPSRIAVFGGRALGRRPGALPVDPDRLLRDPSLGRRVDVPLPRRSRLLRRGGG